MTGTTAKAELLTGPERRRRWAPAEKLAIVQETYAPGVTVSLVARRHGLSPAQLFNWRRLASEGALTAAGSEEPVVPASDYKALQHQIRELQRLLGKKTQEAETKRSDRCREDDMTIDKTTAKDMSVIRTIGTF